MNCERLRELLPELLGGELGSQARIQAEEHLADCATCRDRVADLTAAQSALASVVPSTARSREAVSDLTLPRADSLPIVGVSRLSGPVMRIGMTVLRVAALVAIGFAVGYAVRGPTAQSTHAAIGISTPSTPFPAAYASAAQRFPRQSALAWGMLSLARR